MVTRNWQLKRATCSRVGRFYFYRYCLTIFPVGFAVGRREMESLGPVCVSVCVAPGCALSLLCGCSNHHHFCCFVRYSLGDIFWVSASGKSAVKGQLAARRSQQTSGLLPSAQGAGRFVCQRNKQIKVSKCFASLPHLPSPFSPFLFRGFGIVFLRYVLTIFYNIFDRCDLLRSPARLSIFPLFPFERASERASFVCVRKTYRNAAID